MQYVWYYLILINVLAFGLMGIDKWKARRHKWRIPEATLLAAALLGGSLGATVGMYLFRHKTRHPKFSLGLPVILVLQVGLFLWFYISVIL